MSPQLCTAALLQNAIRRPCTSVGQLLDRAGARVERQQPALGVADQQPPVGEQLQAQRPSAGVADPVDPAAVRADPEEAPSSVPV